MMFQNQSWARTVFSSLRVRLLVLVLFAVVPALLLTVFTAAEQRRRAVTEAQLQALRVARMVSANQQQFIESTRQLLMVLARVSDLRGTNSVVASQFLAELIVDYPGYLNFGVIEANGAVFASGVPLSDGVNLADRGYFRAALTNRNFAVGEYQIGRIHGQPSINCGFPILQQDGSVRRVVYAALNLNWLWQAAEHANLPTGAVVLMVDRSGRILARYPADDKRWSGQLADQMPIVRQLMTQRGEGILRAKGLEGVIRQYAFVPMVTDQTTALATLAVGMPEALALAEPRRILQRNLTLLGLVALLALAAAWFLGDFFILRHVKALVSTTKRLQDGELTARTGFGNYEGELGQLAHALDEMAVTLDQRNAERQRAAAALHSLNAELERRVAERTEELAQKNAELEADLEMAREFQLAFLPHRYPRFTEGPASAQLALQFHHLYRPSGMVGGDFFDIFPITETQAGILICDVMGHGVRAALVTALIRGLVEDLRPVAADPGVFLTEINRSLAEVLRQTDRTMFASAFYLVLDTPTGRLDYATAGHPSPLHLRAQPATVTPLPVPPTQAGPVLGLFPDARYQTLEGNVAPGDTVLLFTDGVYETRNAEHEVFTFERFLTTVQRWSRLPLETLFAELMSEVREFAGTDEFPDDICLFAVHRVRPEATVAPAAPRENPSGV